MQDERVHRRTRKDGPVDPRSRQEEQSLGWKRQMYHHVVDDEISRSTIIVFFVDPSHFFITVKSDQGKGRISWITKMLMSKLHYTFPSLTTTCGDLHCYWMPAWISSCADCCTTAELIVFGLVSCVDSMTFFYNRFCAVISVTRLKSIPDTHLRF